MDWLFHEINGLPLWNWLLQALGLVTSYVGAELNARGKSSGFIVWIASNVFLAVLHSITGLWILFLLDLMFFRVNILGLRRWKHSPPLSAAGSRG